MLPRIVHAPLTRASMKNKLRLEMRAPFQKAIDTEFNKKKHHLVTVQTIVRIKSRVKSFMTKKNIRGPESDGHTGYRVLRKTQSKTTENKNICTTNT